MVSGGTVHGDLSSVQSLFSSFNSEISGLASSWMGPSHDNLVSKAEEFVQEATSGINGQMSSFASACDLYQQYEQTKQALRVAQSNYNTAVANKDSQSVSTYGNEIATHQSRLSTLKSQIESYLSSASSFHMEASSNSGSTIGTSFDSLGSPNYGSFEKYSYTASNGAKIDYYMYLPDYGSSASNLPIHLYFHGAGETGNGVLKCGLPKIIYEQSMTPRGIVICPQATDYKQFYDSGYLSGVLELAKKVASENNGDANRISVSGHSMGAVAGYQLISDHPNDFTAFIPISGASRHIEKLTNVKLWAFHGSKDDKCPYNNAVFTVRKLQQMGADARLYTFDAGHGGVQNYTFQKEYEDENGEKINPLDWAFNQTKNDTVSL